METAPQEKQRPKITIADLDRWIHTVEATMEDFSKQPDSWIRKADYNIEVTSKETLDSMRLNKFRTSYFDPVIRYLNFINENFLNNDPVLMQRIYLLNNKVRMLADVQLPIIEDYVDQLDKLAHEVIQRGKEVLQSNNFNDGKRQAA